MLVIADVLCDLAHLPMAVIFRGYIHVLERCVLYYRYVDYPVPDILEMIGRANRPLVDENGEYTHTYMYCTLAPQAVLYVSVHSASPPPPRCGHLAVSELQERILQEVPL